MPHPYQYVNASSLGLGYTAGNRKEMLREMVLWIELFRNMLRKYLPVFYIYRVELI
jgi:hypothetical protein